MGNTFGPDFNQPATGATKQQITPDGVVLDVRFLGHLYDKDQGVILLEGRRATTNPLVLSIEKGGSVIAEINLELKISPVEQMFRHLNLREGADAPAGLVGDCRGTGPATRLDNPAGLPDTSTDQPWFIFVVGSNVSGQGARGWESEIFKRMYWSKSQARFVGVSWFGDPYEPQPLVNEQVYDYHMAVRDAFATAAALSTHVNRLSGTGSKTIAGHSLGCGVIAAAIAEKGMNVTSACFIDAALAKECFDGEVPAEAGCMTPAAWNSYDSRLTATQWHEFFSGTSDERKTLTWQNLFGSAASVDVRPKVYNFYSSTEDVLGRYEGEVPTNMGAAFLNVDLGNASLVSYVWVYQEKAKGNRQNYYVYPSHVGSKYGGWGFNLTDPASPSDPIYYWADGSVFGLGKRSPLDASQIPDPATPFGHELFKRAPLFDPGYSPDVGVMRNYDPSVLRGPNWLLGLFDSSAGSATAGVAVQREQLLAEAIPALSLPVGGNETATLEERNFNLPARFVDPGWPRPRDTRTNLPTWWHGDSREVAYLFQSRFWDALVAISQQP